MGKVNRTGKMYDYELADIRQAMRNIDSIRCTNDAASKVAKNLGFELRNKKQMKAFRGRMIQALRLDKKTKTESTA